MRSLATPLIRRRQAAVVLLIALVLSSSFGRVVSAQTTKRLAWDEASPATVTGFDVTVDGTKTDYGRTPFNTDGSCNCSIPLPFSTGRHVMSVTAYNASGQTTSQNFIVGPTANAGGPYAGQAGATVTVSGAASTDSLGPITSYSWHWGDGSSDTATTAASASHVYAAAGTFTVTLTVSDAFPANHSASTTAVISAAPPPGTPGSPNPATGATGVALHPTLTWTAAGGTSFRTVATDKPSSAIAIVRRWPPKTA